MRCYKHATADQGLVVTVAEGFQAATTATGQAFALQPVGPYALTATRARTTIHQGRIRSAHDVRVLLGALLQALEYMDRLQHHDSLNEVPMPDELAAQLPAAEG